MDPKTLAELEIALLARREELIAEGEEKLPPNRTDAASVPDEDTQPLTEMTHVISSRNNQKRAEELDGISRALTRMKNDPDAFGFCDECEEEIKLGRLKLMPWTTYCVECQADLNDDSRGHRRRHIRDYK